MCSAAWIAKQWNECTTESQIYHILAVKLGSNSWRKVISYSVDCWLVVLVILKSIYFEYCARIECHRTVSTDLHIRQWSRIVVRWHWQISANGFWPLCVRADAIENEVEILRCTFTISNWMLRSWEWARRPKLLKKMSPRTFLQRIQQCGKQISLWVSQKAEEYARKRQFTPFDANDADFDEHSSWWVCLHQAQNRPAMNTFQSIAFYLVRTPNDANNRLLFNKIISFTNLGSKHNSNGLFTKWFGMFYQLCDC